MFYFFPAGITCLFIASKVEEIYPPKVNEFAYVTDGACTEKAIIDHEIFVLQVILVYFELLDFDSNFHFIKGKFGIFPHCFDIRICVLRALNCLNTSKSNLLTKIYKTLPHFVCTLIQNLAT
jgi:Cyclin, N-terminal domain